MSDERDGFADLPARRYRPCVGCEELVEQERRPGTATYRPLFCPSCWDAMRPEAPTC